MLMEKEEKWRRWDEEYDEKGFLEKCTDEALANCEYFMFKDTWKIYPE